MLFQVWRIGDRKLHLPWLCRDAEPEQFLRHGRDAKRRERQFLCHAPAGHPGADTASESLRLHRAAETGLHRHPFPLCPAWLCALCGVAWHPGEPEPQGLGIRGELRGKDPADTSADFTNVTGYSKGCGTREKYRSPFWF